MKKIIIQMSDGLGNQMFIYGFGYILARQNNMDLVQDLSKYHLGNSTSSYQIDAYNLSYQSYQFEFFRNPPTNKVSWLFQNFITRFFNNLRFQRVREVEFMKYQKVVINPDYNYYLSGFWQQSEYFKAYRSELKKEFTPTTLRAEVQKQAELIKNQNICGLHIRRGDYLSFFGGSLDFDYYKQAINEILMAKSDSTFLVFSDDMNYCHNAFKDYPQVLFIKDGFTNIEELYLMSQCSKLIIANSTFSWWAAFLSNADYVICPKAHMWNESFYLDEWRLIETKMIPLEGKELTNIRIN